MLGKTDLNQIGNVIDEKLDFKLKPIKKDLRYLKKTVDLIVKNYDERDIIKTLSKHFKKHFNIGCCLASNIGYLTTAASSVSSLLEILPEVFVN